jgi:hypothetical protein
MSIEDELIAREAARRGLSEAQYRMLAVADDATVRAIVQDHRQSPAVPSSPVLARPKRTSAPVRQGWIDPLPLEQSYVREVDRLCEAQAAQDAAELRRRLGGGG